MAADLLLDLEAVIKMRGVSHKAVGLLFGLLYEPIRTLCALSIKLVQADSGPRHLAGQAETPAGIMCGQLRNRPPYVSFRSPR